jgi:pimeloyl-ACP methyl ester carboxylesterase/DNA-binding CsgD family transcriptional regulator
LKPPRTRYALSGKLRIAYQVVGQGSFDLVYTPGFFSSLEALWEDPDCAHLLSQLAAFSRLIVLDQRGAGLSDRVNPDSLPDLETRMEDIRAVMDAAGSGRAALLGAADGAVLSMLFAASYPQRTRALVLYAGYAHFRSSVMVQEALQGFMRSVESSWGVGATLAHFAPSRIDDARFSDWWARLERLSGSPTAALAFLRMNGAIDVRPILERISAPSLILHRTGDPIVKSAAGRYLAQKIIGARFVEIPGRDHPIWSGDIDRTLDAIGEFLTGVRLSPEADRVLAALLVTRLVKPELLAARLGDRQWGERMGRLREAAADALRLHGGQAVAVGAEEIGARFDGPARAVRCALALREAGNGLGLDLAAGIHAGEIEIRGDGIVGLALRVAQRLAALAGKSEVLVSGVVTELVAGSGLRFSERAVDVVNGSHGFEILPRVFAAMTEQHLEPLAPVPKDEPQLKSLSGREREVLELVAEGMRNVAIAKRLRLSNHTVKRHVANILLKLDLPTRAAAAALLARLRAN